MVKLGNLLERLFKKAGVDTNVDELKPFIELDNEMADEFAAKIERGLLSIEAAKSNPDVNKALRQSILGVADARMDEIIKEHGVQPGDDFVAEKNTYEKLNMLSKLLLETGKKKAEVMGKEGVHEVLRKEKEAFNEKEAAYQKQLKEASDRLTIKENELKTKLEEFDSIRDNDLTTFELQKILLGKDYVFPKEMDNSLKVATALGAVNNELSKKGFVVRRDPVGQLIIVDKDGNPAYNDKHEKIDNTNNFIDGVLAQNKLLKINEPGNQQNQQHAGSNGTFNFAAGGGKNTAIISEIDAQIANLP